jgi:hypothetical protein
MHQHENEVAYEVLKGIVQERLSDALGKTFEFLNNRKIERISGRTLIHRILYEVVEEHFAKEAE